MASIREVLIAGLCRRGLTQAEAEAEVSQREVEAERVVASEGHLGREAAVAKARALLFAEEPLYVKPRPPEQAKAAIDQGPADQIASWWGPPGPAAFDLSPPQIAAPPPPATRPHTSQALPSAANAERPATESSPQLAAPQPGAAGPGIVQRYLDWTTGGTPLRLLAGLGAPVAGLLIVVMAFASGGDANGSVFPNAIVITVAVGAQAGSNQAGSNEGGAGNPPPVIGAPSQFSPELVAYSNAIQPILYSYSLSLDSIAKLAAAPSMGNSTWTGQVNAAAQTIKSNNGKLRDLKPPSCVAGAQAALLKAAETMDKGADSLTAGVRSSNGAAVNSAAAQLASADTQLNQATNEIIKAKC